jgi:single-strand DNA-binding protein
MYSKLQDGSFMISGFVAKDAEMKTSQNGKTYTRWSVKVATRPSQNPNERGEAVWTNCIAWHNQARAAGAIKKGDSVFCIGKLETNDYEGKTYKTLNCEYIGIMGKTAAPAPSQAPATANTDSMAYSNLSDFEEILSDGDVPF